MSQHEQFNEQDILDGLFETAANLPEEAIFIGRLSLRVTLRGLTSSKVDGIRERCTVRKTTKGQVTEKIDSELFNAALIKEATASLEVIKKASEGALPSKPLSVILRILRTKSLRSPPFAA